MSALGVLYGVYLCYAAVVIYAYLLFERPNFPMSNLGSFIVSAFTELSFGGTMYLLQGLS